MIPNGIKQMVLRPYVSATLGFCISLEANLRFLQTCMSDDWGNSYINKRVVFLQIVTKYPNINPIPL